jgi:hypothetical protein
LHFFDHTGSASGKTSSGKTAVAILLASLAATSGHRHNSLRTGRGSAPVPLPHRDIHAPAKSVPRVREARLFHFFCATPLDLSRLRVSPGGCNRPSISCARGTWRITDEPGPADLRKLVRKAVPKLETRSEHMWDEKRKRWSANLRKFLPKLQQATKIRCSEG